MFRTIGGDDRSAAPFSVVMWLSFVCVDEAVDVVDVRSGLISLRSKFFVYSSGVRLRVLLVGVADILLAVELDPLEPFVESVAGMLLVWPFVSVWPSFSDMMTSLACLCWNLRILNGFVRSMKLVLVLLVSRLVNMG